MTMLAAYIVAAACFAQVYSSEQRPAVNTALGEISGIKEAVLDTTVDAYLGIPFAKPPVGDRRFKRPAAVEPWTGTYDAATLPPPCAQPQAPDMMLRFQNVIYDLGTGVASEDCLYLNIWTHARARNLPVMIWIHGGGFTTGSTDPPLYSGRYLTERKDVIVVSIQYRLGLFGMLYLDHEDAPGNMGLLDQHLAIKWVYDNIESFGGDKGRLTIFGESAGAGSVVLQLLTDLPQYFHNAIIQSTSGLYPAMYKAPHVQLAMFNGISEHLGCTDEDVGRKIACLRRVDQSNITNYPLMAAGFTTDNYFFERPPHENYGKSKANVIIGTNENEGYLMLMFFKLSAEPDLDISQKPHFSDQDYMDLLRNISAYMQPLSNDALQRLDQQYRPEYPGNVEKFDAILNDWMFTGGSNEIAGNLAAINNVHMYRLKARTSTCMWPEWNGVGHGCDLDLVFGHALDPANQHLYTPADIALTHTVVNYWTNFVKTGNPNSDEHGKETRVEWPKYTLDDRMHLVLDVPELSTGHRLKENLCSFWDQLLKEAEAQNDQEGRDEL